jgi:aerobic carbon-monoxide dehydrogenase medium subunit
LKPAPFEYHAPERPDEVGELLREFGDDAKILAGGQSLIPMLALRLAMFGHLVDVTRVDGLRGIERRNGSLWVGATTLDATVEHDPLVATSVPLLARATPHVGHFQIRNRGTVGGSLAHADPAAEYPAVALALDAELSVRSPDGARTVPAAEFFTGLWTTALGPDDLLDGVTFPIWEGRSGFAVEEFARRDGDFAIAGACVGVQIDDAERVTRAAIALIGLGGTPERGRAAEAAATGTALADIDPTEVGHLAVSELDSVPADAHGSSAYRTRVGAEMVRRAWISATEEARHG